MIECSLLSKDELASIVDFGMKEELLTKIANRPLLIWGARMIGIGLSRFLTKNSEASILGFIDSDTALDNLSINGGRVYPPSEIINFRKCHKDLLILVAVATKEDEIINHLKSISLSENDFVCFSDYSREFYTIEIAGLCNLKCPSCIRSIPGEPRGKIMSLSTFKKVVDKILSESGIVSTISLFSWGEPLLNPELPQMVEYLHDKGISSAVSSNLSIGSVAMLDQTIRAGVDYFKVSISGYYPEAYNFTHSGGDINLVKSNLYRIRYLLDKYRLSTLVDINYHLYRNNCGVNLKKNGSSC